MSVNIKEVLINHLKIRVLLFINSVIIYRAASG